MTERKIKLEEIPKVVIQAGDTLVLCFGHDLSIEQAKITEGVLKRECPGIRIVIASNVTGVVRYIGTGNPNESEPKGAE